MAGYRFLLSDLLTGDLIGELPLSKADYSFTLNAPGAFKGSMPLEYAVDGVTVWDRASIEPAQNAIYVERDGRIMWGGILWSVDADVGGGSLDLAGQGFMSYFRHRVLKQSRFYWQWDRALIVKDLLDKTQAVNGGDIGIDTSTLTSCGSTVSWLSFDGAERKVIADIIDDMAEEEERGFDWGFRTGWDSGSIATTAFVNYPASGRRTDHVFELGTNCELFGVSVDATDMATSIDVTGAGDGSRTSIGSAADASAIGVYPVLDHVESATDVSSVYRLRRKALRTLTARRRPLTVPKLRTYGDVVPVLGSYEVGDRIRVRGEYGWLDLDDTYRIVDLKVAVEPGGHETIGMTLAPLEAFYA